VLAAKDYDRFRAHAHPEIDFRGLTPNRVWEAQDPETMIAQILQQRLEPSDEVQSLEHVDPGTVGDRERVGYRLSVTNRDGRFVVEQQAYLAERDGRRGWMRVVCSGFRPVDGAAASRPCPAPLDRREATSVAAQGEGAEQIRRGLPRCRSTSRAA
jgi:hypothetical protein